MHAEAVYWTLLTERHPAVSARTSPDAADSWLADLVHTWLRLGNRSLRDLFELHPEALAATLGRPLETLTPLLSLRTRIPRAEKLLAPLDRVGVDLLPAWDRRYPRALRELLGDLPPVLWYAGDLGLLARQPIAVAGARDSGPEALVFTRAVASALAAHGRVVLGGLSRAVERAALESALSSPDGAAIGVLGQGIGRALADLQRLQPALREGRLLVVSPLHPEAFWQPHLEELRQTLTAVLADRVVVAHLGTDAGTQRLSQLAREYGRPLLVPTIEPEEHDLLPADGAVSIPWPAASTAELLTALLQAGGKRRRPAKDSAPAEAAAVLVQETIAAPLDSAALEQALLRLLRRRKNVTGKGQLLQTLGASELELDRALAALIATGAVVEQVHRTGAGYLAVADHNPAQENGFQLSLFGQS